RDYTPKYFHCRFLHSTYNNNLPFAAYLAGLIEGDGTIIIPNTLRSPKGKLNYPSIQIVFHLKDLPLALMIQKELGFGSLSRKKGVNAYILTINNKEEADGTFQVRSTLSGKYPKFEYHKGFSNQEFLNKIADLFNTEVKETRLNKSTPEYRVRTTNLQGNNQAKSYLIKYPLFGTKYLDSID
ncbi:hypothetical protein ASPBRDRAFT_678116, partial [Aspergillus brasiliensis CBS 101740]